jgi:hypothetical protein
MNYLKGLLGYTPKANTGSLDPRAARAFDEHAVGGDMAMRIAKGEYEDSVIGGRHVVAASTAPQQFDDESNVGGDAAMMIMAREAQQAKKKRRRKKPAAVKRKKSKARK